MSIRRPEVADIIRASDAFGLALSKETAAEYLDILEAAFLDYDIVDRLVPEAPKVQYPRTPGYRPAASDNPYNSWQVRSEIRGQPGGKLSGLTAVMKDNICVAGMPMMNGSSTLQGYVPDIDATVVTRMLDAGVTILGKAQCEYFCVSGSSHTSAQGPVRNPHNEEHSAGGSSSGCGALVASGLVDLAIGTDQGGSVRIPAAYSGFCGMKPTHGLVPYTGIMPIEMTLDHPGLMTANVKNNALLLEVVAGYDGLDPRQYPSTHTFDFVTGLEKGCEGLKIAVLTEGFGWLNSQSAVDQTVRAAADLFRKLGAQVDDVSLPMHRHGHAIWSPVAIEGTTKLLEGLNYGSNWKGLYVESLMRAQRDWKANAAIFPPDLKTTLVAGHYFGAQYHGRYYAKAQNLVRRLKAAYDVVLLNYDILLMPTVPIQAPKLPPSDGDAATFVTRALEMNANTAPFNVTGLPAMSIPCGMHNGLPIGMMLVGRDFSEATIYRAAHAFEAQFDWKSL